MRKLFEDVCAGVGGAFLWLTETADIWPLLCIGFIAGAIACAVLAECAGCAA